MSTADIIATISTTIAAASLVVTFLQYRASKIHNRTETNWRADQYKRLVGLADSARRQAETAKAIMNTAARGAPANIAPVNIEDLKTLADMSGKLAVELLGAAEETRPTPSR